MYAVVRANMPYFRLIFLQQLVTGTSWVVFRRSVLSFSLVTVFWWCRQSVVAACFPSCLLVSVCFMLLFNVVLYRLWMFCVVNAANSNGKRPLLQTQIIGRRCTDR